LCYKVKPSNVNADPPFPPPIVIVLVLVTFAAVQYVLFISVAGIAVIGVIAVVVAAILMFKRFKRCCLTVPVQRTYFQLVWMGFLLILANQTILSGS
jgi:hypothetical protein